MAESEEDKRATTNVQNGLVFFGGQKKYSQEFVFPSFWRTLGELFGVNSYRNPRFGDEKAQFVHEILRKASDELCYWKTFSVPDFSFFLFFSLLFSFILFGSL